jgi:hypothetical protein
LVRTFASLMLCWGAIALMASARAADGADTLTANYLLQCQKDPAACQTFTNNALRTPGSVDAAVGKVCAPLPLNRDQTNQLVQWILARPEQSTGHASDDIAMAGRAIWPCK